MLGTVCDMMGSLGCKDVASRRQGGASGAWDAQLHPEQPHESSGARPSLCALHFEAHLKHFADICNCLRSCDGTTHTISSRFQYLSQRCVTACHTATGNYTMHKHPPGRLSD